MSKVKFELNKAGVRELLKSTEAGSICMEYANQVQSRAGEGYIVESRRYPERTGAAVYPETYKAVRDNLKNNTLLKSLGGGV